METTISGLFSSKFEKAIEKVFEHEGGYVNDPKDAGGETKYGISKKAYPKVDIKNLTKDSAKYLYYIDYWKPQSYSQIHSDEVAGKVFDLAVNIGTKRANELLQRALRAVGNPVKEDGIIGSITLTAVNNSNEAALLAALRSEAAGYYRNIVTKNANQQKFINGWLNRAYA